MSDALTTLALFFGAALLLVVLAITVTACVADARRRGKSPILVVIAVVLCFPWGLIAWLLFRPAPLERPNGRREFRLENHRVP
jgi:hypothetical protein